jgi:hypothetical protein
MLSILQDGKRQCLTARTGQVEWPTFVVSAEENSPLIPKDVPSTARCIDIFWIVGIAELWSRTCPL